MNKGIVLSLCLAAAASAAAASQLTLTAEQAAEKDQILREREARLAAQAAAPSAAEWERRAVAEKALVGRRPEPGAAVPGAGLPGKEERLAQWRSLPEQEAYGLFKELGRDVPLELALGVNQSMTVLPWSEDLRQGGGSPGTAIAIAATNFGDSFGDHGNTALLSNYLGGVPYRNDYQCPTSGNYDANDAWYVFTLSQPTLVTATTCAATFYYDTRLGIFNTSLDLITGNDDNCGGNWYQSTVACCLDPGTYYLVVDGYSTSAGEYDLGVTFAACPAVSPPTRGGTDAFGHRWINSFDGDGPDFNWTDISGYGTPVTLGDDDYTATPVPIGFAFPFYGIGRTEVYIASNGFLGFTDNALWSLSNTFLPDPSIYSPNDIICALWDDLNPGAGGTIHYYSEFWNGRFIVQYTGVPAYGGSVPYTFQIILDQAGDILIQYLDVDENDIASATVGVENELGTDGLTVNFNGAGGAIADGSCVRILHPHPVQGGPDAYGYTWANSHAAGGPPNDFTDISWSTNLGITGDDQSVNVVLPWAFPFYGGSYSSVDVTSNGWLGFNLGEFPAYYNGTIPDGFAPNNAIYVFWDDLYPPSSGTVYYYHDAYLNRAIFQWSAIANINSAQDLYTFQAILHPTGEIILQVAEVAETYATSNTVGLENADGTVGLQARANNTGSVMEDNLAIRFTPPQPRPTRGTGSGYAWISSLDADGPDHAFMDISGTGINTGMVYDDEIVNVALPFSFPFYSVGQTQVQICSNGWLGFNNDYAYYYNTNLPDGTAPNNIICPFWDDLFLPYGGSVLYQDDSAHGRFIVQWNAVPHINGMDGPYTFQAQLYSNGEIYFHYQSLAGSVASATVGVENGAGTIGLAANAYDAGCQLGGGITVEFHPIPRVPASITDLAIQPVDFSAGQATVNITFTPVTTDVLGAPLAVDHYTIFTVQDNGHDFSNPYVEVLPAWFNGGSGLLYYHALGWTTSAYLYLVAVDSDGVILASSTQVPWRTEREIPGFQTTRRLSVPSTPAGQDAVR